jgi:predicted NBD/HSP70 family sugar kinase
MDKQWIEGLIRTHGPISRVGIYQLTQLRRSTISQLTRQLLAEGKLIEVGRSDNPLGRKQILLKLNPKFGFIGAVQFDDQQVAAAVLDLEPSVVCAVAEPTDLAHGQEGLLRQLKSLLRRAVKKSGCAWSNCIGIGIADPGLVDTRNGVIASSSTIEFWNNVPVRERFRADFVDLPVLVESKTRTTAVAERMLGAGEKQPNMIYFDYGTGIGAGVIVDGHLLYGQNCGAGEVGHMNVLKDGPRCKCGSTGCLEALAGASAVENRVRKAIEEGVTSHALAGIDPLTITAWQVFTAAAENDKLCWNIVAEVADDIGMAVANLVNLFNPSVVVMDHRLRVAGEEFLSLVARTIKSYALASSTESLQLRFAYLGSEAGLLGLGLRMLDHHFAQTEPAVLLESLTEERSAKLRAL